MPMPMPPYSTTPIAASPARTLHTMRPLPLLRAIACGVLLASTAVHAATKPAPPATASITPARSKPMADILAASKPQEWRALDPDNTLYLELPGGRVVMELAVDFAPEHARNIKTLVREKYFDGLFILRSQDNYVVQWGDPNDEDPSAKPLGSARAALPPEFTTPITPGMPFTKLPDGDGYAPQVGFSQGFPVGRDPKAGKTGQTWLTHCYGALGVSRGNELNSGNGSGLYVTIGHAPRHLDRNIAVVGRVVQGIEKLSVMPRGTGPLGFYEKPEQRIPLKGMVVAADVPLAERTALEVMRTDSASFAAVAQARRNRRDDWYVAPAGHIELCNVPIPVRAPKN
jgi:peptidylprolyl isomerase